MSNSGFPFKGFVFDVPPATPGGEWLHNGGVYLRSEAELEAFRDNRALPAMRRKIEVMICDADDFCSFHSTGGEIVFPPKEVLETA